MLSDNTPTAKHLLTDNLHLDYRYSSKDNNQSMHLDYPITPMIRESSSCSTNLLVFSMKPSSLIRHAAEKEGKYPPTVTISKTGRSIRTDITFQQIFAGIIIVNTSEPRNHRQLTCIAIVLLSSSISSRDIGQIISREILTELLVIGVVILFPYANLPLLSNRVHRIVCQNSTMHQSLHDANR